MGGQPLGIAVIGVGAIGQMHADHIATRIPGARLVAIADPDGSATTAVAARSGPDAVYEDHRRLLKDGRVEAVIVAAPRRLHSQIIREAAEAGKHVFCEKPAATGLAEMEEAAAAVRRAGVAFQVGFNRRFDATYLKAHETLAGGRIGAPRIVHIVSRDPQLPGNRKVTAEDLFLETTVHDFDMARFLCASEVTEVHVLPAGSSAAAEIEHCVTALRFASGAAGTIDNSLRSVPGYDQRVEVLATGGAVRTGNETADRAVLSDAEGSHVPPPLYFFRERYAASYLAELTSFVKCLRAGVAPAPGADAARAAIRLALAALRSYREGRPVSTDEVG